MKHAVAERDGLQYAFIDPTGRRCSERAFLELEHTQPLALGGVHAAANVQLCHAHNQHRANQAFGTAFMNDKRKAARGALTSRCAA